MTSRSLTGLTGLHVVAFGAGTGMGHILKAVRGRPASLTAIVSVTDDGGHSGLLRTQYGIPQVGDAKQCLLALARDGDLKNRFAYRFPDGHPRAGESIGNQFLAEYTRRYGIGQALAAWGEKLGCVGTVLPATEADVHIVAELVDSTEIIGEWNIIKRSPRTPISKMKLSGHAPAYRPACDAIQKADLIIISPGSFYTGIISSLLPKGIHEALATSTAQIVMVSNMMTQPGLTDDWDAIRHVDEIIPYLDRTPTTLVVNDGKIPDWVVDSYSREGSTPVGVTPERIDIVPYRVLTTNLVPDTFPDCGERPGTFKKWPHLLVHCPDRTMEAIELAMSRPVTTSL